MAKNETRRLIPIVILQDRDAFSAVQAVTGYAPANSAFTVAKLQTYQNNMDTAQQGYAQALAAFESAKNDLIASEWGFHNLVLGAKDQVVAQFGADSNEVEAVGLKRKSEYKSPKRNGKTSPAPVS